MTRAILTCSPYFTDSALNEVRRHQAETIVLQHLAPGYVFLQTPYSFDKLTAPWRHRLPIYLHHLFPVHAILTLRATAQDLLLLRETAHRLAPSDATVQVRTVTERRLPYSADDVLRCLNGQQPPHTREATDAPTGRVLSILIVETEGGLEAYLGISWATQNISPWAGGRMPVSEAVSNGAGFKLLEAIETFSIQLRPGDQALDLGAAPGAWTTLLRQRGLRVTAVAPTPLYPWLMLDPTVNYQRMLAEDYLDCCQTTFALIVNDMKLDAQDSARLMGEYARHLRKGGIAVMTLKLRERNRQRIMDHAFRILRKAYKIIHVRQLVSNRKEVTLFLRRKT